MKASELMIGDWVRMRRCDIPDATFYTSKVICLQKDGFLEYEPIPLTAEILEKNGFDVYCESEGVFYVKVESESAKVEKWFTYAHELQHALRLCGLNDLADSIII